MISKETVSLLFTGLLVICALVVTGLVVQQQFFGSSSRTSAEREVRRIKDWQQVASEGNVIGPQDAPVKIVEFSDYQCPFCSRLNPVLKKIRARYPDEVALIRRHMPLPNHPEALPAARAAECAAEQNQFASYHNQLFDQQDRLGEISWAELARRAGVTDVETFESCIGGAGVDAKIERDVEVAQKLGINGVPTLIVNGRLVLGMVSMERLDEMVRDAIAEQEG